MLALIQTTISLAEVAREAAELILPEAMLVLFGCAALVLDVMLPRARKQIVAWVSLTGVGMSLASLTVLYFMAVGTRAPSGVFFDMLVLDNYAVVFKLVLLIGAGLSILLSIKYLDVEGEQRGEYYSLVLFSLSGMLFLTSAVDLLTLFISLELMAISVYVLVGYLKRDRKSNEAAMKYFLLGAFSSGVLLYGISMIYGLTGSTHLSEIAAALPKIAQVSVEESAVSGMRAVLDVRYLLVLGMILMAAGMFFKVAAVPFHMWAPDAYEGAPTPITGFMSVAVKTASFAMFGRLFLYGLPDMRSSIQGDAAYNIADLPGWGALFGVVAAITIVWGNLAALTQNNTKRLLAYSSISHAGFVLLGMVAGNETGYTAFIIYLFVYTLMNLGVFGCLIALRRRGIAGDRMEDLNGLMRKAPGLTVMMTIFLLSLGGIPPTAGFIGKLWLFMGLIETGNPWLVRLAILAVLMSAVSLYYYIRFIKAMYIEPETELQPLSISRPLQAALAIAVLLVVLVGVYPQPFISISQRAATSRGLQTYEYPQRTAPSEEPEEGSPPEPSDQ